MPSQHEQMIQLLESQPLVRARELKSKGVEGSTIARAVQSGEIVRVSRGLYQLADAVGDEALTLAEASKRVPKGVICLYSALAYHGLTDQMPRKVWLAITAKAWMPRIDYPPLKVVRFTSRYHDYGIEMHCIAGMNIPIYSVAKTLADAFRNLQLVERSVAIAGLRHALANEITTPAAIADAANACGAWRQIRPYLEALTVHG